MSKTTTEVRLLSVPLENDYLHTLYFASKSAQETYFKSKTIDTMENCTYQRKEGIIRYDKQLDEILNCNYVMYKNPAYSDRWFYAFVTKLEYKDDGRTDVYIETDVIQTWLFDYTVKPSFVEREHVADDTIGIHTVPEGLETGEYVVNDKDTFTGMSNVYIILATTVDITAGKDSTGRNVTGSIYTGLFSGVNYYAFTSNTSPEVEGGIYSLKQVLKMLAIEGQSDSIVAIFTAPGDLIPVGAVSHVEKTVDNGYTFVFGYLKVSETETVKSFLWDGSTSAPVITKLSKVDTYTPKNNKLLTYPYVYMNMSNNAGGNAIYKYEQFNREDPTNKKCCFKVNSAIAPGCSIRLIPLDYKGVTSNNDEGLNAGKFPICSWATDVYTNWLTQNSVNIGTSIAGGLLSIAGGVASAVASYGASSGASIGMIMGGLSALSGVTAVAGAVGEVEQHSFQPPQHEGNLNAGDVTFAGKDLTFTAYHMSIKKEFAQIVDNFFTMFGYKLNLVKTPYKNHRENFWYTKTIDVNIDGAIPGDDMRKIKDCYNKGITFWKNPANIGDYSVSNNIIV